MGTRHLQSVITKDGDLKLLQYGQWDGYPEGQGVSILAYLRSADLNKYQDSLSKLSQATKEQISMVEATEKWADHYPYLSRDCGSDIHAMIEKGTVKFVIHMTGSKSDSWCEGFYTIDFQQNVFLSEYHDRSKSYPLDKLPTEEQYLIDMEDQEE